MQKFEGQTMGSYWRVNLAAQLNEHEAATIFCAIEMVLNMINQRMSTYIPHSEIERFGDYQGTDPVPISPEMRTVVSKALQICAQTEGVYDITVAPLVNIWGFGPLNVERYPSEEEIQQAKSRIDHGKLTLSAAGLAKSSPALRLDLCSIAKGYGVDRVAVLLEALGFHDYIVEIGGENRISGSRYGESWRIGIERPQGSGSAIARILAIKDVRLAIATSGNYRNYSHQDGQYATHEINTQTGYSQISNLLSVTVVAEDCMSADGYATALMLLGDERAPAFAEQQDIPALFMIADDTSSEGYRLVASSAFETVLGGVAQSQQSMSG